MGFYAHGEYDFSIQGQIIIVRAFQEWNLECSKKFAEDYKPFILRQKLQRFGVIADLRQFEGGTPDAITYFGKIAQWAYNHGQIARAQVIDSQLKAYTLGGATEGQEIFPTQNFDTVPQAIAWLVGMGLAAD